jgi:hypothetical protein
MQEVTGQRQPGLIGEDLMLRGQITGSATVAKGVHLLLLGQVAGDLTIDEGASAEIFGMVCGDLINRGKLEVSGTVIGALRDETGEATIDAKALIGERG